MCLTMVQVCAYVPCMTILLANTGRSSQAADATHAQDCRQSNAKQKTRQESPKTRPLRTQAMNSGDVEFGPRGEMLFSCYVVKWKWCDVVVILCHVVLKLCCYDVML